MGTLLAVDLGGTKCAAGLFELNGDTYEPLLREVYSSADYSSIDDIIGLFLKKITHQPDFACLGVAGIVQDGGASMTNLSWKMNEISLAKEFSFKGVRLINDLTALCAAIPIVSSDDLYAIQEGVAASHGTIGVVAPGTGLGEGYLFEDDTVFYPQGSEGGHANFSPVNETQIELLRWLQKKHKVVSVEMVCAGPAIANLYEFLKLQGEKETDSIKEALLGVNDKTPVIVTNALGGSPCPLCVKTVEMFLALLGSEAGNLALKLYTTRGLYIGGGILPRLVGKFPFSSFLHAFQQMGAMEDLVKRIPVKLIVKKDIVLHGAARYGRKVFVG